MSDSFLSCRVQVVIPSEPVAASFSSQIDRITAKIIGNIHQGRALAALRDALLPQLMFGELRLKHAESQASEVI
jgi:type I restriction enzyme, S subunit